jgi:hypothetical protein
MTPAKKTHPRAWTQATLRLATATLTTLVGPGEDVILVLRGTRANKATKAKKGGK